MPESSVRLLFFNFYSSPCTVKFFFLVLISWLYVFLFIFCVLKNYFLSFLQFVQLLFGSVVLFFFLLDFVDCAFLFSLSKFFASIIILLVSIFCDDSSQIYLRLPTASMLILLAEGISAVKRALARVLLIIVCLGFGTVMSVSLLFFLQTHTIEGVRARVSQPSFYNSLPVCSIMTFRRKIGKSCKLRVGPLWLCDPFNFPLSLSLPSTWNFSSFTYNFLLFRLVRFQPFFPFF